MKNKILTIQNVILNEKSSIKIDGEKIVIKNCVFPMSAEISIK